jgi:hypothetical protein
MKQKRYGIAIVVLALAALVLLTGCDWVVEVYPSYSINGEVINAVVDAEATGSKVSQPLVILENSEGTEVARTTASTTGRFQFANVTPGVYTVTGRAVRIRLRRPHGGTHGRCGRGRGADRLRVARRYHHIDLRDLG